MRFTHNIKISLCNVFLLGSLLALYSCRSEVEPVSPLASLSLTVSDDAGNLLTGARVALFENYQDYLAGSADYTFSGSIKSDTTINGKVILDNLASGKPYWICVHYRDYNRIPGTYIDLDNGETTRYLRNPLLKNSVTSASISLTPAFSVVTFWTGSQNMPALPVTLFIEKNLAGTITGSFASAPAPFEPGALTVHVPKGIKAYSAKSQNGCAWKGEIHIKGGENLLVELPFCEAGIISFWTDDDNLPDLPVDVVLGINDVAGQINNTHSAVPVCGEAGVLSVVRAPGIYTYRAYSTGGDCLWTGQVTLNANDCVMIKLEKCVK